MHNTSVKSFFIIRSNVFNIKTCNCISGINHIFNGQGDMMLNGIVYLPNADVQFAGGAFADPTSTAIIADTVTFTGNSEFGKYDISPVAASPQLIKVTLLE